MTPRSRPPAAPGGSGAIRAAPGNGPVLLLFDIDLTLVNTSRAGVHALRRAIVALGGAAEAMERVDYAGRTDQAIIADLLAAAGLAGPGNQDAGRELAASTGEPRSPVREAALTDRLVRHYLRYLEDELRQRAREYRVLPGVLELLDALAPDAAAGRVLLALGTGNLEPAAELKLRPSGLWPRFVAGGFGSDALEREAVLAIAVARAAARIGRPIPAQRVLVIGDTPRDIAAARAIGAHVIAVATGSSDLARLAAHRPDLLVPDLAQGQAAVLAMIARLAAAD